MRNGGTELQEDSQESEGHAVSHRVKHEMLSTLTPPRTPNFSRAANCKKEENTGDKMRLQAQ